MHEIHNCSSCFSSISAISKCPSFSLPFLPRTQNMTLLQKKLSSVEEELSEVRGMMDEERGREEKWREGRDQLQTDLKVAEKSVEDAYAEVEKEKGLRYMYMYIIYKHKFYTSSLPLLSYSPSLPGPHWNRISQTL